MSVTLVILIITVAVSYFCFNNPALKAKLVHHPYSVQTEKQYYRWVTSGLVHRDWWHLGINMFVFYQFGEMIERIFSTDTYFGPVVGPFVYLLFYLGGIIFSDLIFFQKHKNNPYMSSAGASGAVSAIIFAYMLFFPWVPIYLYGIIPIYSIIAGILYLGYESYAYNKNNANDSTNHLAHIFGAVYGIVGLVALKPTMLSAYLENLMAIPF
jgi:membrane associated rhomboid family serine protease